MKSAGGKVANNYIVNSFDCGCRIVSEFAGGLGVKIIEYCPTHKAAPFLLEALRAITDQFERVDKLYNRDREIITQARAAIRKAEGK